MAEVNGAFENVLVVALVACCRFWARDIEDVAKLGEEELIVSSFGGGG